MSRFLVGALMFVLALSCDKAKSDAKPSAPLASVIHIRARSPLRSWSGLSRTSVRLAMPAGTGVSGLESDGADLLYCGGGMSGKSGILKLVFDEAWPTTYDPGFVAMLSITIPLAVVGGLLVRRFGSRLPRHVSAAR